MQVEMQYSYPLHAAETVFKCGEVGFYGIVSG